MFLPLVMESLVLANPSNGGGGGGGGGGGVGGSVEMLPFDFNSLTADDIILGLADRLFRAASGRVVKITLTE